MLRVSTSLAIILTTVASRSHGAPSMTPAQREAELFERAEGVRLLDGIRAHRRVLLDIRRLKRTEMGGGLYRRYGF